MATRINLADGTTLGPGWGAVEHRNGLSIRWLVGDMATVTLHSQVRWSRMHVHCRFADAVHHGVLLRVAQTSPEAPGADQTSPEAPSADQSSAEAPSADKLSASGSLQWTGYGFHHQRVIFDRLIEPGPAILTLEPIHTWAEPGGSRRLSVAFASMSIDIDRQTWGSWRRN
ncbi:MAG: hypothetical protein ABIQ39_02335 [Ilumatobacteraceae bacterium]